MSAPPIYGKQNTRCPTVPESNTALLEYIQRMNNIMNQLYMKKEKAVALERIDILKTEVQAKIAQITT
jgi:hypothetical protein